MRNIQQEVAHSRGKCNLRRSLKVSGEITLMVYNDIVDGSPVFQFRMLSGAPEWMDALSGAPALVDS